MKVEHVENEGLCWVMLKASKLYVRVRVILSFLTARCLSGLLFTAMELVSTSSRIGLVGKKSWRLCRR